MYRDLYLDLQLLENQLAFFVLDELYTLAVGNFIIDGYTFLHLAYRFFEEEIFESVHDFLSTEVKHFINLRRVALLKEHSKFEHFKNLRRVVKSKEIVDLPCAVKLHESGVKFKGIHEGKGFLDIRFVKGKQGIPCFKAHELEIPNFEVSYETECLLRNLLALEQCHYSHDTLICNCIDLLDHLIDTAEDVNFLVGEGIISNYLGDSASVANMFNKLRQEVFVGHSYFYEISEELKAHYNNSWNHTMAMLKRVYFSNLWRGAATVAAVILLLLTVIQTVCSIFQVT